uniref:WW domain-containing protein n=1 Tax=Clastoptera arizonana TaxID=38151 RepID=A0A1B6DE45_9HEMI
MSDLHDVNPLPPGWDSKYDTVTGKRYFINYFTRNTSLDDPRLKRQNPETIPMQDLNNIIMERPAMGVNAVQHHIALNNQTKETELKTTNMEQSVAKISAVFPTVKETHIKMLLLKYLKSVFPVVEETLLLDTLCNSDNNVHQATETLVNMGFDKRATPPPRVSLQKRETIANVVKPQPPMPPRMKSVEEKEEMKARLLKIHSDIEERVVSIALDSVDYCEEKADQILNMMKDEPPKIKNSFWAKEPDSSNQVIALDYKNTATKCNSPSSPVSALVQPTITNHRRQKGKQDFSKIIQEVRDCDDTDFKSPLLSKPCGHNKDLHQGPNDNLLLSDYVTWTGSNHSLVKGPDKYNLGKTQIAWGPDPKLRKGPLRGLAKGSIYSRLSNITLNGTRGK